jgi:ABC-type amino acid transport substrate-binding protein
MRKLRPLFIFLLLGITACNTTPKKSIYIGVDPTFFPMELMGKEPAVLGFTNELLQEITRVEKCHFQRVNIAWDTLLENLHENKVQGIMSSMYPYVFNLKKYAFSNICLATGPVLVVPEKSDIKNLKMLHGAEVAVLSRENEQLLVEHAPGVIPRKEISISQALGHLIDGQYQAAFLEAIPAQGFVTDIYQNKLKIVTTPIDDTGMRLVTSRGENDRLIKIFNNGLNKLLKSGKYQELLLKWKL